MSRASVQGTVDIGYTPAVTCILNALSTTTIYILHLIMLPLQQHDRRRVALPTLNSIIDRRENNHAPEHRDTPIHRGGRDGRGQREESKHEQRRQEDQGRDVDRHSRASERPAARGERLPAEAAVDDAADGEDVGGHEGGDGDGVDSVEGHGRAEVDKGDEDGDAQGDQDGVQRDVGVVVDLEDAVC